MFVKPRSLQNAFCNLLNIVFPWLSFLSSSLLSHFLLKCCQFDIDYALFPGRVIFSTTPQEHYFDCPFQLSSEMVGQTYLDAMVPFNNSTYLYLSVFTNPTSLSPMLCKIVHLLFWNVFLCMRVYTDSIPVRVSLKCYTCLNVESEGAESNHVGFFLLHV